MLLVLFYYNRSREKIPLGGRRDEKVLHEQLKTFLKNQNKKTIELDTLQKQMSGAVSYLEFAEVILQLEAEGILIRIKSSKENNKVISLGNKYGVKVQALNQNHLTRLHQLQLELHQKLSLENYFHMSNGTQFEKDVPYIRSINAYLKSKGLPKEGLTLPKLSYELGQDEKWLQEKGGIALLKRIKLWTSLEATLRFEPVVFSIDPKKLQDSVQFHLIIENKTTFIELMETLPNSPFTALIYGAGWQIISSIQQFKAQMGTHCEDHYYYFGDLDHEGIHIWYRLNELSKITLATPFYHALLKQEVSKGKVTQKRNELAVEAFIEKFDAIACKQIETLLLEKSYYPQETLSQEDLQTIMESYSIQHIQN